jgi:hypothetical protein
MAAPVGLEPTTARLTAVRSAIELWGNTRFLATELALTQGMGMVGIEPTSQLLQSCAKTTSATFPNRCLD